MFHQNTLKIFKTHASILHSSLCKLPVCRYNYIEGTKYFIAYLNEVSQITTSI